MFSNAEDEVLKILGRKKMTIHEIMLKYYEGKNATIPMDPENYIGMVIRRIAKKCAHFKLDWTIVGTRSVHGRTVWKKSLKDKQA